MRLDKIKDILDNNHLSDQMKINAIIDVLAKDENVINIVLNILSSERKTKSSLIDEMNLLLSKSHIGLDDSKVNADGFMQKEIVKFYKKHKGIIGHCFKSEL